MRVADTNPHSSFASFWQAGFEGADHVNGSGTALSMIRQSGHLDHLEADYSSLGHFGIGTVRESAGWRLATRGKRLDLSHVVTRARARTDRREKDA